MSDTTITAGLRELLTNAKEKNGKPGMCVSDLRTPQAKLIDVLSKPGLKTAEVLGAATGYVAATGGAFDKAMAALITETVRRYAQAYNEPTDPQHAEMRALVASIEAGN